MNYGTGITFGAFDPFHWGHLRLFIRAAEQCERLVVGLSTDADIAWRKGRRSRFHQDDRALALSQLRCVDEVVHVEGPDAKAAAVDLVGAEVIFVGSDWQGRPWDGAEVGLPVIYLPRTKGVCSSDLVVSR